jgi:hypothetical protein
MDIGQPRTYVNVADVEELGCWKEGVEVYWFHSNEAVEMTLHERLWM